MAIGFQISRCVSQRTLSSVISSRARFVGSVQLTTPTQQLVPRHLSTGSALQSTAGKHWFSERAISIGLLALIPTGLIYPNAIVDYSIAALLPLHMHWGIKSVIIDYIPKSLQGVMKILLYTVSIATFGGLVYLTYNDVGVSNAVRMVWAL